MPPATRTSATSGDSRAAAEADEALEHVRARLRSLRAQLAWATGIFLAIALGTWVVWLLNEGIDAIGAGVIGGFGLLMGLACGAFLLPNLRVEQSKLMVLLRDQPHRVLWVFAGTQRLRVQGVALPNAERLIHFYDDKGKARRLRHIDPDRFDDVWAAMPRLLPDTTFGYTDENRAWYTRRTGKVI